MLILTAPVYMKPEIIDIYTHLSCSAVFTIGNASVLQRSRKRSVVLGGWLVLDP